MTVQTRCLLAAAFGLGLVGVLAGQEPGRLGVERGQGEALKPRPEISNNQRGAEAVVDALKQSGRLQGYQIDVSFQNGLAELTGVVGNQPQREEAIRIVQGVPGVERVRDRLTVSEADPLAQAQAAMPPGANSAPLPQGPAVPMAPLGPPMAMMPMGPMGAMPMGPMGMGQMGPMGAMPMGAMPMGMGQMGPMGAMPMGMGQMGPMPMGPMGMGQMPMGPMGAAPMPGAGMMPYGSEPPPAFQAGATSPYALNTPAMPPYAWPTYAPYNNYSRVAYPTAYPYHAWPFIGPQYPFPKVPLGWRRVQLEWQDGHWWFSKLSTCFDWWRLRYW